MGANNWDWGVVLVSRDKTEAEPEPSSAVPEEEDSKAGPGPEVPGWLSMTGKAAWFLIGILILLSGVVFATTRLSPVFIAIFVALILKALLNPLVERFSKVMNRWVAVVLSLVVFIGAFAGMLGFVITMAAEQWPQLSSKLTHGVDMIVDFLQSLPFNITMTSDDLQSYLKQSVQQAQDYLASNWKELATAAVSNAGSIAIGFTIVFLAMFLAVFFLHSGGEMWRWFLNMLPTRARPQTNTAAQAGWVAFSGYARGTVIIAVADGLMAWVFLEIVGIPLAPALGVLVLIGAFIPLVGAPAAMVVAMVVALAVNGVWSAVIVGVGIALIGQFEGHVLQPLIMGKQVSLSPVVVIIGVISGTILGGLLGAAIAVPLMGVVWAVFSSLYHRDPPIEGPLPVVETESVMTEQKPQLPPVPKFLRPRKSS